MSSNLSLVSQKLEQENYPFTVGRNEISTKSDSKGSFPAFFDELFKIPDISFWGSKAPLEDGRHIILFRKPSVFV